MNKYKPIKLKHRQTKNFNNKMGIYNSDGIYYIFFDYVKDKFREGLGYFLGKGNSPEEALIDALKNLNKKMIYMAKKIENFQDTKNFDPYEGWYGSRKKNESMTLWTIDGIVEIGEK